ncbi:MAG: hypothetical protein ACRDTC_11910 [Pseudonocardiaceae bacterium]
MPTKGQVRFGATAGFITMTCASDGRHHLVSDHASTTGLSAGHGTYAAACGHVVVAASMVTPPGPTCLNCETALHRMTTNPITTGSARHSPRRLRHVVSWLLRRRTRPAHSRSAVAAATPAHRAG